MRPRAEREADASVLAPTAFEGVSQLLFSGFSLENREWNMFWKLLFD